MLASNIPECNESVKMLQVIYQDSLVVSIVKFQIVYSPINSYANIIHVACAINDREGSYIASPLQS